MIVQETIEVLLEKMNHGWKNRKMLSSLISLRLLNTVLSAHNVSIVKVEMNNAHTKQV